MPLPVIDPAHYAQQLQAKRERLTAMLTPRGAPTPEVYSSPPRHYRMRAEFRVQRDAHNQLQYVMFDPQEPRRALVQEDFPAGSERINTLMPALRTAVNNDPVLGERLFQVEFLTTLSGDALITLIYHRPLDPQWERRARALQETLGVAILGRSRKQKCVLERDYVEERLRVDGRDWHLRQIEGGFTQPNAVVNQAMLGWASAQAASLGRDLLELYCGNGNFTVVLARHFHRVLATEMSKASVAAARHNLTANGVANVDLVRLASAEVAQALAGVREFRRLRQAGVDLADYDFGTLFVDPPRAGLDSDTLELARSFPHILYISCNPETLAANMDALADSHRIVRLALFDQFPYTHHLECGTLLVRHY